MLGGQRADGDLVFFLHVLGNAAVKGVARHRQAGGLDPPAHADDRNVGGAAADVHDHAAVGLADLQARAQRRCHRLVHKVDLPGARRHDGLHNASASMPVMAAGTQTAMRGLKMRERQT